jgi:hypothetical protein
MNNDLNDVIRTNLSRQYQVCAALVCASILSFSSTASATRADALLQIDLNRTSVIEKIVESWKGEIPAAQIGSFRRKLTGLRADRLLAANLSGSFDGVLEVVDRSEVAERNLSAIALNTAGADSAKSLGELDRDLAYTPITPCTIVDTRSAGGIISAGTARAFDAINVGGNFATQGGSSTSDCAIPAGAKAIATSVSIFNATANGYITLYPQGDALPFSVTALFNNSAAVPNNDTSAIIPLCTVNCAAGKEFNYYTAGSATNVLVNVVGYFMPPNRNGNGLRILGSGSRPSSVNGAAGNTATGDGITISGGGITSNTSACEDLPSGGRRTCANITEANFSTIGGGYAHEISSNAEIATIAGGEGNTVKAVGGSIGGGYQNSAYGGNSSIAGGFRNYTGGNASTVGGGSSNVSTGVASTIPGGRGNVASGDDSFAAGRRAKATLPGQFVWADSNDVDFNPTAQGSFGAAASNTFHVRATGGVRFVTGIDVNGGITTGCFVSPAGTGWSCTSDRNLKESVRLVSPGNILERLVAMPVTTWSIIGSDVRQMGPMAQDFYKSFNLGTTDRAINSIDAQGVAFAAIQGLNQKLNEQNKAKDKTIAAMQRELTAIKKKLGLQ